MTAAPYSIIDLGSNSFHMLTVHKKDDGFEIVSKHKQKVRLAAGLDEAGFLDKKTMQKGWLCLQNFKEKLGEIQPVALLISATAALRIAKNSDVFLEKAEQIIGQPINLISGIQEAQTIFKGVAFTEKTDEKLLVLDIGGASTELILGEGSKVHLAQSLEMGCVTWLNNYFADNQLSEANFAQAIAAAKAVIATIQDDYLEHGWSLTVGASGTIQAVSEINAEQKLTKQINLSLLNTIKSQCIECQSIETLNIAGLQERRVAVFASGLSILIALFESLSIEHIQRSKGALREGLISMLFNNELHF